MPHYSADEICHGKKLRKKQTTKEEKTENSRQKLSI